jgi:hypothetical protein
MLNLAWLVPHGGGAETPLLSALGPKGVIALLPAWFVDGKATSRLCFIRALILPSHLVSSQLDFPLSLSAATISAFPSTIYRHNGPPDGTGLSPLRH